MLDCKLCPSCSETQANISALIHRDGASWETLLSEIEKCVVRCANCHRRKTAREQNSIRFRLTRT